MARMIDADALMERLEREVHDYREARKSLDLAPNLADNIAWIIYGIQMSKQAVKEAAEK